LILLLVAFIQSDAAALLRENQWFAGHPQEPFSLQMQASVALLQGQDRKAKELLIRTGNKQGAAALMPPNCDSVPKDGHGGGSSLPRLGTENR
jgi:hypothetical protein